MNVIRIDCLSAVVMEDARPHGEAGSIDGRQGKARQEPRGAISYP